MAVNDRVRGIPQTVADLKMIEPTLAAQSVDQIYTAAKGAAAALRASVPSKPLSNMEGGPVRASVKRGAATLPYYNLPNSTRLATIALTGPKYAVISDMAAQSEGTMVPNLDGKYGLRPSRWVWPTVEKHIPQFVLKIETALKATEVMVNTRLRRTH